MENFVIKNAELSEDEHDIMALSLKILKLLISSKKGVRLEDLVIDHSSWIDKEKIDRLAKKLGVEEEVSKKGALHYGI